MLQVTYTCVASLVFGNFTNQSLVGRRLRHTGRRDMNPPNRFSKILPAHFITSAPPPRGSYKETNQSRPMAMFPLAIRSAIKASLRMLRRAFNRKRQKSSPTVSFREPDMRALVDSTPKRKPSQQTHTTYSSSHRSHGTASKSRTDSRVNLTADSKLAPCLHQRRMSVGPPSALQPSSPKRAPSRTFSNGGERHRPSRNVELRRHRTDAGSSGDSDARRHESHARHRRHHSSDQSSHARAGDHYHASSHSRHGHGSRR